MAKKTVTTGTKKAAVIELPELKDLKTGADGYKSLTTTFDSEFLKVDELEKPFEGKYIETLQAGKKGEEKPCALFVEKDTNKKFLIGSAAIMKAVEKYGQMQYRITYKGKKKSKSTGFKYSDFEIEVKELKKGK